MDFVKHVLLTMTVLYGKDYRQLMFIIITKIKTPTKNTDFDVCNSFYITPYKQFVDSGLCEIKQTNVISRVMFYILMPNNDFI